ncbi:piRNA biogenesis protein EXD1 [Ctenodactylus gundi]
MDACSDYHFLNQILWRRLRLTLVCGVFEGELQHLDPDKIVVLKKVKNVETGQNVPGVRIFFGHEIVNVELVDKEDQGAGKEKTPSCSLNTERAKVGAVRDEDLTMREPAPPAPELPATSLLDDLKYSPLDMEELTYMVIDEFQQKFGAAMFHIKKQSVLSVAAEGSNVCRHGKLCWLQVATSSRVYLFDIFLLGRRAFNNGLQMILEDKRILKVIHDCRWLSDCLSHQYGIVLNNVFDTQVADVLQFSMETGGFLPNCISSLQESLLRHLKVAPKYLSFLEERQKLTQENPEVWFTRPLSPALLKILALEAIYLLPLRLVLLDDMMSDLTTLVDSYLNTYREGPADRLAGIEASSMELPAELLQLKNLQQQRRERATQAYRVNAKGLLIRTVPPPKKPVTRAAGHKETLSGFLLCKNDRVDKAPSLASHPFHEDVNFLKGESKTPAKSQHLPSTKREATADPGEQPFGSTREGSKDQRAAREGQLLVPKPEFQAAAAGYKLHEADGSDTAGSHGLATSSERERGGVSESGRRRRRPSARSRLSAAAILGSQEPPRERARSVPVQRSHRPTASESEPRRHRRRGDPPLRTPPAPRPPSAAAAAAGPHGPSRKDGCGRSPPVRDLKDLGLVLPLPYLWRSGVTRGPQLPEDARGTPTRGVCIRPGARGTRWGGVGQHVCAFGGGEGRAEAAWVGGGPPARVDLSA